MNGYELNQDEDTCSQHIFSGGANLVYHFQFLRSFGGTKPSGGVPKKENDTTYLYAIAQMEWVQVSEPCRVLHNELIARSANGKVEKNGFSLKPIG